MSMPEYVQFRGYFRGVLWLLGGVQGVCRGCEIWLFFMKIGVQEIRAPIVLVWRGGLVWGVDMHEI